MSTRVLIAARVRLFREGFAEILAREREIEVVGMAGDASEALSSCRRLLPDVMLVDPTIEDGIQVIREVTRSAGLTAIAVGCPESEDELVAYAEAGVTGFVSREDSLVDLIATMRRAALGELVCSPTLAGSLIRRIAELAAGRAPSPSCVRLTLRELEVAQLIDKGLSNKQIALQLHIELPTVKHHVHHILEKAGVAGRGEAVMHLREQGLLRSTGAT